ncbi:MAG: NADPH:quinone reductase [Acidobacteria bacterium SCN 69-37]|nr:MAG: NADPH:quinone reductase [Acidobacteria bacterium SCN 69-37]
MKRIVVHTPGGPGQMVLEDGPAPVPGPADVVIDVVAAGVNFIDVYFRSGQYKAEVPLTLGSEAAGTVSAVGADVRDLKPGDRVAYAMVRGAYAEQVVVPAAMVVRVPDAVPLETAAAAMLQGMTAHYLTRSTFPLEAGQTCLVHAAAGGAGGLIVQMARRLGVRTIGTVSTDAKAQEARALGCDEVIKYTEQDFEVEVKALTGGRGVDVVYDSVGRTTFEKGLAVLRPRGVMALFGQSSGAVAPIDPQILNTRGSVYLTRPSLAHYVATTDELRWRAAEIFDAIIGGDLTIRVSATYPLAEAARAHEALEGRKTVGKLLLGVR